jgi:glyoxylase-like metal-dependent hydrolase (beta-lactamase superfamily II)
MTADSKALADRDATKCYVFGDVTYVPHYLNDQFFVGPGFPKFQTKLWSIEDLVRAGAKEKWLVLWPRPKNGQRIKEAA